MIKNNLIFEWDDNKAKTNKIKHGVSFELATRVFDDPFVYIKFDRIIGNEQRWHAIGDVGGYRIVIVVHTVNIVGDNEIVRIISARKATKQERIAYGNN